MSRLAVRLVRECRKRRRSAVVCRPGVPELSASASPAAALPRPAAAALAVLAILSVWHPGHAQEGGPSDSSHVVPLFPAANDAVRQGFVRVVNHSGRAGKVEIRATGDDGSRFGPTTLTLEARETVHFNSTDLEEGNETKGLPDGVGSGIGDWRLELRSGLDIEVLSYIRTPADGFLTSMHDLVPVRADGAHRVAIFNPGSNADQVSIHDVKRRVCRVRNWWWLFRFGRPVSNERRLCGRVAENLLARKAVGCLVLRRG